MDTDQGRAPLRRGNHSNLSPHDGVSTYLPPLSYMVHTSPSFAAAEEGAAMRGEGRRGETTTTKTTMTIMTKNTKRTKKRENTDQFDNLCIKLRGGVRM